MVGNRESDFRGAQWIGRLLRLEGDALVGAHAFHAASPSCSNGAQHQWSWIPFQIQQHFARPGSCLPTGTSAQVSA